MRKTIMIMAIAGLGVVIVLSLITADDGTVVMDAGRLSDHFERHGFGEDLSGKVRVIGTGVVNATHEVARLDGTLDTMVVIIDDSGLNVWMSVADPEAFAPGDRVRYAGVLLGRRATVFGGVVGFAAELGGDNVTLVS